MAIDCCEHTVSALEAVPAAHLTTASAEDGASLTHRHESVDIIVIGIAQFPVRRLFISNLRRIYPRVPILILRRVEESPGSGNECVRGEFLLSDEGDGQDISVVTALRNIFPLKVCTHVRRGGGYDTVREVVRVITKHYQNPGLDLNRVAEEILITPGRLSRILNQQVGISFRQLLRQTRIEEAKRMLASGRYSVKEVAALVGFMDSHYFSRSFKEMTGVNASEYHSNNAVFS